MSRQRINIVGGVSVLTNRVFFDNEEPMNFCPRTNTSKDRWWNRARIAIWLIAWGSILLAMHMPYIDPGTSGLLSQVLYVMFYGAFGLFFYMLRYIKQYVAQVKQFSR
jgi:hypothetical protein